MLMREAGLKMTHVPYRGMPQAVTDVVANHVQMVFADPAGAPALIKEGKLRALAVSSKVRIGAMPDVPTMEEAGFPGFEAVSWHMIVGPAGMPKEIVDKLAAEFKRIGTSQDFKAQVDRMGLLAIDTPPPDELKTYLDKEIASWGQLVRDVGIAGTE
jgi:tripartite-type tricarboxylate transporter receptor subunit TctC